MTMDSQRERVFLLYIFRVIDGGLCDVRRRPCKKTNIFGQGFIDSDNITCHVTEFKVRILYFVIMIKHSQNLLTISIRFKNFAYIYRLNQVK